MAWNIRARIIESCSCRMVCECTLGPAEPDQGWCSGAIGIQVLEGHSDGVDLSGAKVVFLADAPGDFLGGIDTGRLFVDADDQQRPELDAILHGERGGVWAGLKEAIGSWMPTVPVRINITDAEGDSPSLTIDGVGEMHLHAIVGEDGRRATLNNAPVAAGGFGQDVLELARSTGTRFAADGMRSWESLGYGTTSVVEWRA